jgi:hypothetical protein
MDGGEVGQMRRLSADESRARILYDELMFDLDLGQRFPGQCADGGCQTHTNSTGNMLVAEYQNTIEGIGVLST